MRRLSTRIPCSQKCPASYTEALLEAFKAFSVNALCNVELIMQLEARYLFAYKLIIAYVHKLKPAYTSLQLPFKSQVSR